LPVAQVGYDLKLDEYKRLLGAERAIKDYIHSTRHGPSIALERLREVARTKRRSAGRK